MNLFPDLLPNSSNLKGEQWLFSYRWMKFSRYPYCSLRLYLRGHHYGKTKIWWNTKRLHNTKHNMRSTQYQRVARISYSRSYHARTIRLGMNIMIAREREYSICFTHTVHCASSDLFGLVKFDQHLSWLGANSLSICGILNHFQNLWFVIAEVLFCRYSRHHHIFRSRWAAMKYIVFRLSKKFFTIQTCYSPCFLPKGIHKTFQDLQPSCFRTSSPQVPITLPVMSNRHPLPTPSPLTESPLEISFEAMSFSGLHTCLSKS